MKIKKMTCLGAMIANFAFSALCADFDWMELNQKVIHLFKSGQPKKAFDLGNQYVEQIKKEFKTSKMITTDEITFLVNLGIITKQAKEYQAARDILNLAVECKAKIASPNDPLFVNIYKTLGDIHLNLKDFKAGEECYRQAIKVKETNFGPDHAEMVPLYLGLADFYQGFGKNDLASGNYEKALKLSKVKNGEEDNKTADVYFRLGEFNFNQKIYNEAEKAFLRAFSIYDKNKGSGKIALVYDYLGFLSRIKGNLQEAESYFRIAAKSKEIKPGKNSIEYANSLNNLGLIYSMQKNKEAEGVLKESLKICENLRGKNSPTLAPILSNLADYYSENGNKAEAERYLNRVKTLKS